MKIANRLCFFMFFIVLSGCKDKILHSKQYNAIIEYDTDSVYYRIDVMGDENKELFMVTREILVADSSFGGYTYKNWQKAWAYSKTKYKTDEKVIPDLLYKIHFYKNNDYEEFSKLIFRADGLTYPVLKSGQFTNLNVVSKKNLEHAGTQYLKIMEISDTNLSCKSINLVYKNKKWQVFSKEVISYSGYCLDTIRNNFDIDLIRFDNIFIYDSEFKCLNN